jgi:hypothetical protein
MKKYNCILDIWKKIGRKKNTITWKYSSGIKMKFGSLETGKYYEKQNITK